MRIEIVEECEHGNFDCDAYGRDWNDKEVTCPGGDRREATESELLTLVADLLTEKGSKVWYCKNHKAIGDEEECVWASASRRCRMTERFLLPVGVLVDGPKEGRLLVQNESQRNERR